MQTKSVQYNTDSMIPSESMELVVRAWLSKTVVNMPWIDEKGGRRGWESGQYEYAGKEASGCTCYCLEGKEGDAEDEDLHDVLLGFFFDE